MPPINTQANPGATVLNTRAITQAPDGTPLGFRLYEVCHKTRYTYAETVPRSTHTFRLQPVEDSMQELVHSELVISSPHDEIRYEDVFGNNVIQCEIKQPYTGLDITATSTVKIFGAAPDDCSPPLRDGTIPLVWTPWLRQMMTPYLLSQELPEAQLMEINNYAGEFAKRNGHHLMATLDDINATIYRDFDYVAGITSLRTTAFEVYETRKGVCQDFANLFICMARLLGIPARYRMGYIHTNADYENKIQSEASHAWVELYLPYIGWRGYDPTNGCRVRQNHIRVACGRKYSDATPTSGTLYGGGGNETLDIDVRIREVKNRE